MHTIMFTIVYASTLVLIAKLVTAFNCTHKDYCRDDKILLEKYYILIRNDD